MRKIYSIISFISFLLFSSSLLKAQIPLEIFEIQGSSYKSDYENQSVVCNKNIVTAIGNGYFYIQTPSQRDDHNPKTSNGILVYNGIPLNIGDFVNVEGTVQEINGETAIDAQKVTKIGNDQSLPTTISLNKDFPKSDENELEKVEGMLVHIENGTTNQPLDKDGFGSMNASGIRSFREPGNTFSLGNNIPIWDGNHENFILSLNNLNTNFKTDLPAGTHFIADGVISNYNGDFYFLPTNFEIKESPTWKKVPAKTENEFTIGSINCLLLFDDKPKLDLRITKLARFIVQVQDSPDILAVQEVGTINVLNKLIKAIHQFDPKVNYTAYLPGDNDIFNTAFLVKNRISNVSVRQLAKNEQVSFGGRLHYRPPLLLEGKILSDPIKDISVLNLHLKSFLGLTSSTETPIRRQEQALSIAKIIKSLQLQDKNIVVVGDFNAYPFTDGYTDPVNQIAGTPSLGAKYPIENIGIDPPLIDQYIKAPLAEQYSYIYQGTSQIIDHCLTGALKDYEVSRFAFAHGNTDYSDDLLYKNVPYHASDHDGFVVYLDMKSPVGEYLTTTDSVDFPKFPTFIVLNDRIVFKGPLLKNATFHLYSQQGQAILERKISAGDSEFIFNEMDFLPTGFYFFTIVNQDDFVGGKMHFFNH